MALASALARMGRRVLLVDLDPQGHSTIGLGVEVGEIDATLHDVFTTSRRPIKELIHPTGVSGLDILPSDLRLAPAVYALYNRPKREEILSRALEQVRGDYDYIIIDCPPSLGVLTETGLTAADLVLVPFQMEARAADALVDLLEMVSLLKGEAFDHWRIFFTKLDRRKKVTNQAISAAVEGWRDKILQTSIPQSEPLNQAQIARKDIFSYQPKSTGALAYQELAQEIINL